MGEVLGYRRIVHQKRPVSSGRNALALVMTQHSWSLVGTRLGRVSLEQMLHRSCRCQCWIPLHRFLWRGIWVVHTMTTQGGFSGECIHHFVCPVVLSRLCLIVIAMLREWKVRPGLQLYLVPSFPSSMITLLWVTVFPSLKWRKLFSPHEVAIRMTGD